MGIERILALATAALISCAHADYRHIKTTKDEAGCTLSYEKSPLVVKCDDITYDTSSKPALETREDFGKSIPVTIKREYLAKSNPGKPYKFFTEQFDNESYPHTMTIQTPKGTVVFEIDGDGNIWHSGMKQESMYENLKK